VGIRLRRGGRYLYNLWGIIMLRFPLKLRVIPAIACLFGAALVPGKSQSMPGVINDPLAVGTVGYGVIEASDGNYYALSQPNLGLKSCADNSSNYCSYIYQIKKGETLSAFHTFQEVAPTSGDPANKDGLKPIALIEGTDGNFYGACETSGPGQFGTIFKITPNGTFSVLASFGVNTKTPGILDPGFQPVGLIQGIDGNLYFVNASGVYSLNPSDPSGAVTTVATFPLSYTEGSDPYGYNASSIMQASDGNFYVIMGTTPLTLPGDPGVTAGGIVQVTPTGQLSLVHAFALDGSEGNQPQGPLVQGPDGYLYGTTNTSTSGGTTGTGLAFKVMPSAGGTFTSLGPLPSITGVRTSNGLFVGSDGNLYGTTVLGGNLTVGHCAGVGCGELFRMTPDGTFTTVYAFQGGSAASPNAPPLPPADGADPEGPVVQADDGDFIGSSSGFTSINSPVFFDIDLEGSIKPPISLVVSPTTAGLNTPVKITWSVLNAFSDTAQNCGAVVQGGLPGISGWSGQQTGTLANGIFSGSATITPTRSGAYVLALVCGGNEVGFANLEVSEQFQITSLSLPDGKVNVSYGESLTAIGGTGEITWSVANMPPGLTLNSSTGAINGKPLQFGDYTLAVTATDSSNPQNQTTASVTLKIVSGLAIETTSVTKATIGGQYTQKINAQFGLPTYLWTITSGALPPGITLTSGTPNAVLSGIPTQAGNYTFTLQVADFETNPSTQTATYTLKVSDDVQIASVEFTQAIQQYQTIDDLETSLSNNGEPPVPLVAGKWAVMRVYFTELKDATNVTLTVTGSVVGVKPFKLAPGCAPLDQRAGNGFCRSMDFYFIPQPGPWSTVLTLTDATDNQLEQETLNVTSRTTSTVLYKAVSICSVPNQPSSCQDPTVLPNLIWFANKVLPTALVVPSISAQRIYRARSLYTKVFNWESDVLDDVAKLYSPADQQSDTNTGQRTDYAGIYSTALDTTGVAHLSSHDLIIPNSAPRQDVDGTPQVLAHETGHTLSLTHTGIGNPHGETVGTCYGDGRDPADPDEILNWIFVSNYLQSLSGGIEYGFDVGQQSIVDGSKIFDVMAYCMNRWISPFNYKNMFPLLNGGNVTSPNVRKKVKSEPAAQPKPRITYAQGSYMQVSGTIPATGIALDPIFTENMLGTSDPGSGSYSIQEQGAGGAVLFTRSFTPIIGQTDTVGTDFFTDPLFNEFIPVLSGAASVAVLDPTGNVLTSVALGTPPTVTITSPAAGFVGSGEQNITWTATSPSATSFYSRIYYSTNNGTTWQDVLDTPGTSAVLDFSTIPGAAAALLRIDVSDGVNTGSATSIPFNVPKKMPSTVVISSPVSGSTFAAANPVSLAGAGYDADDGLLTGTALLWSDNIEGNLGSGAQLQVTTLKPGAHTITLTATDSDGNAITATTEITLAGDPPVVTLTTATPYANFATCFTATINSTPGAEGSDLSSVSYSLDDGATYTSIPLTTLPFTFPVTGTGNIVLVAAAQDASGQVGVQSTELNLGTGCTATTLTANGGGGQSTLAGTAFTTALSTLVVDQSGNPVSGATVTYAAPVSGASATLSAATATTNSSGIATVTATANSTAGAYSITATASNGGTTATFALTNTDFQIAAASSTLDVSRGSSGTDTITLTALDGFNGTVVFSCSGLAAGATCSFSPPSITPTGASSSSTMTVAATASTQVEWPWTSTEMLACMIFAFCYRRRRYIQWLTLALALAIGSIALGGCGSSAKQTPPVTSTVTVTATSGATQRTTTITVQIGAS
jgi:uncharacterized repeat protein (TIGR03803 family)